MQFPNLFDDLLDCVLLYVNSYDIPRLWILGSSTIRDVTVPIAHVAIANWSRVVHWIFLFMGAWTTLSIGPFGVVWWIFQVLRTRGFWLEILFLFWEHMKPRVISLPLCDEFQAMITICDLMKIKPRGVFYTWIGQGRNNIVLSCLDKALCSPFFGCLISGFFCYIAQVAFGSPLFVDFLFYECFYEFKAFRFQGMWISHLSWIWLDQFGLLFLFLAVVCGSYFRS